VMKYDGKEVAKKYGVSEYSVFKWVRENKLRVAFTIGGKYYFTDNSLREFNEKWRNTEGMTAEEVAEKYDISRDAFLFHVRLGRIRPFAKRGKFYVYDEADIEYLAQQKGWVTREELEDPLP